jgi:hypothetical protein
VVLALRPLLRGAACLLITGLLAPASQAFELLTLATDAPAIAIDGRLSEDAWRQAPVHAHFAQLQPRANAAYADGIRTQVQVLADSRALIVGIRAWSPTPPQVLLSRRDAVQRDQDLIGLWIDTGGRGESAMFVKASLAGVVTDGLYRASDDEEELGPDFPVEVAATRLADGYSMEIRWPLAALRYPYQAAAPWRLVVARAVPGADDLLLVSGQADGDALDFLHASLPIQGLAPVLAGHRDRREAQATVEWTGRSVRADGRSQGQGQVGVEAWWRPRADWLVNATLNPDFAQVDIDAPQASGNRAVALALPEKRRYFLESADVLGLPVAAFYSRTIADPRWGLRATWRGAQADATALVAEDRAGAVVTRGRPWGTDEWTLTTPSVSQLLRGRWQSTGEGYTLTQGAMLARRSLDGARYNQLVGTDGLWRSRGEGRHLQAQWSLMASEHTLVADDDGRVQPDAGRRRHGEHLWGKLVHSDERWINTLEGSVVGADFVNTLGFVDQAGLWRLRGDINRRLGELELPLGSGLTLHQSELHLGLAEYRSLRDTARGEPGGEVVNRELRVGAWWAAAGRSVGWFDLAADQQRARSGGRLHAVPALHGGFEATPFAWLTRITGEGAWGRQLDAEFDRTGRGGWWSVQANTRWPLPGGRSLEVDPVFTGVRIARDGPHPALAESGLRWLALLHLDANESIRLIVQNQRSRREASSLGTSSDEQVAHRSLMWKRRFGTAYQLALGAQWDTRGDGARRREIFLKLQATLDGA